MDQMEREVHGVGTVWEKTIKETWNLLDKVLKEENLFSCHSFTCLPRMEKGQEEVTGVMRDNMAQVLKCLKVLYDLPSKTFITALQMLDMFLGKIKTQPKHLSCIALSCLHLSLSGMEKTKKISPSELIRISQNPCSARDVLRMEGIIIQKLGWQQEPVTALNFLQLFYTLYCYASEITRKGERHIKSPVTFSLEECTRKLEVLACSHLSMGFKGSVLALAILSKEIQTQEDNCWNWKACIADLQFYCKIKRQELKSAQAVVTRVLSVYNQKCCLPDPLRQKLSWKLSVRTLRQLRLLNRWRFSQLKPVYEVESCPSGVDLPWLVCNLLDLIVSFEVDIPNS
ncbi:cyclin-G1-like [Limulus polyphemus]|uniref:Cyclin-G1-like n=1 Tax=Limulus polyphemus TaxID=6850 RepID=A0ABM1T9S6_LIMPO|nr:cyclin-G1-like [Limulus polyphemus]